VVEHDFQFQHYSISAFAPPISAFPSVLHVQGVLRSLPGWGNLANRELAAGSW
jgi:hypothetical protein